MERSGDETEAPSGNSHEKQNQVTEDPEDYSLGDANGFLSHMVSLAFDNLALSAGYGGVVQCPYDPDEDEEALFDDGYFTSISEDDLSNSDSSSLADEDATHETVPEAENDVSGAETKRIRTSMGIDDVAIELAARPLAVASLTPNEPQTLYTGKYVQIRNSDLGGFGMFATEDLQYGQHILVEKALFHAGYTSCIDEFKDLSPSDQQLFLDLHGYNPEDDSFDALIKATFATNDFTCRGHIYPGVFLVASRFNHACSRRCNVKYAYDSDSDTMTFTVGKKRGVKAGMELTICYGKDREGLREHYGFDCQCGACDSTLEELWSISRQSLLSVHTEMVQIG